MIFEFKVNQENVDLCYFFAESLYDRDAASPKQHGTSTIRSKEDFIADHVRGKITEFAFRSFLFQNFKIVSHVDLEIFEGHNNTDEGHDLETIWIKGFRHSFNLKADIKGIGPKAQWHLVESHKFWADVYIIGKILTLPEDRVFENNPYALKNQDWIVQIEGFISAPDIYDPNEKQAWFEFRKGDRLYSNWAIKGMQEKILTLTPKEFNAHLKSVLSQKARSHPSWIYLGKGLDANLNYGYPINWLRNTPDDWNDFVDILIKNSRLLKSKEDL